MRSNNDSECVCGTDGGYMIFASRIMFGDRLRCGLTTCSIINFVIFLESTAEYRRDLHRFVAVDVVVGLRGCNFTDRCLVVGWDVTWLEDPSMATSATLLCARSGIRSHRAHTRTASASPS